MAADHLLSIFTPTMSTPGTFLSIHPIISIPAKTKRVLWIIYVISVLFLLCFCMRLFIDALWSPAGKGLTPWLSFVQSNCEVVTFPLVSLVRCGA